LRHYATSWNVTGLCPDEVSESFQFAQSFQLLHGSGVYSASKRNEYQKIFLGLATVSASTNFSVTVTSGTSPVPQHLNSSVSFPLSAIFLISSQMLLALLNKSCVVILYLLILKVPSLSSLKVGHEETIYSSTKNIISMVSVTEVTC
jgi:hypothetical protein